MGGRGGYMKRQLGLQPRLRRSARITGHLVPAQPTVRSSGPNAVLRSLASSHPRRRRQVPAKREGRRPEASELRHRRGLGRS